MDRPPSAIPRCDKLPKDPVDVAGVVSLGVPKRWSRFLLVCSLFATFTIFVDWFDLGGELKDEFSTFLIWVIFWVAFRFVLKVIPMSLRGFQEMAKADLANGLGLIGKLFIVLLALHQGLGLKSIILGEYAGLFWK